MKKIKVGILGATGYVGQRFVTLLENHPFFEVVLLGASENSEGKRYGDLIKNRWKLKENIPEYSKDFIIKNIHNVEEVSKKVDLVFCAVDMKKDELKKLEEDYAKHEVVVVSNNSAHRWTEDVPVVIPEVNKHHFSILKKQKERLGTKKGFIVCKPNCSVQCYVPLIEALMEYEPDKINVVTYQAISGAGKTFDDFEEIIDNIIPYIGGEEEKSEKEPLKIWGKVENDKIVNNENITISAQCIRVPVSEGHMAAVSVSFKNKPTVEEILNKWENYSNLGYKLPHETDKFITYIDEENRPQTKLDRDTEKGMGIVAGRLREDSLYDYKFIGLAHNTIRGAAGGAVLTAEVLYKEGYLE